LKKGQNPKKNIRMAIRPPETTNALLRVLLSFGLFKRYSIKPFIGYKTPVNNEIIAIKSPIEKKRSATKSIIAMETKIRYARLHAA
jgi:hypothetical protein